MDALDEKTAVSGGMLILESLERSGRILPEQAEEIRAALETDADPTALDLLFTLNYLSIQSWCSFFEQEMGVEYVDLRLYEPESLAPVDIEGDFLLDHVLLPVRYRDGSLLVATDNPLNTAALDEMALRTGLDLIPVLALKKDILPKLNQYVYWLENARGEIRSSASRASAVLEKVLRQAHMIGASDIHIQPERDRTVIRWRVDGVLLDCMTVEKPLHPALIAKCKIMGGMDIAQKKLPQDGSASVRQAEEYVDLRLSVLPTVNGEKAVVRMFAEEEAAAGGLYALGWTPQNQELLRGLMAHPSGLILVTGPTGSGKTTTLYAAIRELESPEKNIVTIENPVEKRFPGVTQVNIDYETGLTFAQCLRSVLRQDPDVIMVGEIRDQETSEIAMRAAITGHLVLSTLHAGSAAASLTRLIEMGVPSYLAACSVAGVISQRLVREICPFCREEYAPSDAEKELLGGAAGPLSRGRGCEKCGHTGYRGRRAVHEILVMNQAVRDAVAAGRGADEIERIARLDGSIPLRENTARLVLDGVTTTHELLRVCDR